MGAIVWSYVGGSTEWMEHGNGAHRLVEHAIEQTTLLLLVVAGQQLTGQTCRDFS